MLDNLKIRQAEKKDIEFVIEAIIESEKSGSDMITSCRIFGFSIEKFREILIELLEQDVENYDYYLSGFLVSELNGEYVGALGSWLEAADDTPSGILKATMLFPYLDKTKIKDINKNTKIIKGMTLPREAKTLQLEHGYTREKFRRQGAFSRLLQANIKRNLEKYGSFDKVQGILFKENFKSYYAHLKFGYDVIDERTVDDPAILDFFPYNSKVLMELNKEKILKL